MLFINSKLSVRLDYRTMGFNQRMPVGYYPPHLTFHNAVRFIRTYTMHSTNVTAHGFNFIDRNKCGWQHTDYRFELSSKMFPASERNTGGNILTNQSFCLLILI